MSLWQDFMCHKGRHVTKWTHYFPIYERFFSQFRNKPIIFMEIGVMGGGSLDLWCRYFGPQAQIIGIDINPYCEQFNAPPNVHVRIGDQSDPDFLQKIYDEFGAPDIVLDDGSHMMDHVSKTFEFFYPKITTHGVYMVEDMHTAYWEEYGGGVGRPGSFIEYAKTLIDKLNADHSRGILESDAFTRHTQGISFFDSMVVFERGTIWNKQYVSRGDGCPS